MICVSLGEGSLPVTPRFWLAPYVPYKRNAKISILTQVSPRLYSNEKRNMNVALINKQNFVFARFSYSEIKPYFMFKKISSLRCFILWLQCLAFTNQVRPQRKRARKNKKEPKPMQKYNVSTKEWMKDNSTSETLCSSLLSANSAGCGPNKHSRGRR